MIEEPVVAITTRLPRWKVWLHLHRLTLAITGAVLVLVAVGTFLALRFLPAQGPRAGADPLATVRAFMEATASLDEKRIAAYIAPAGRPQEILADIQLALGQVRRLEYRSPSLELLDNNGQTAHVHLAASLYYELVQGGSAQVPLNMTVTLVQSRHRWYVLRVD